MSIKNPRYKITFYPDVAGILNSLAHQENKSISNLANELILEALEYREDMTLSAIAEIRDTQKQKTIAHHNAWKKV